MSTIGRWFVRNPFGALVLLILLAGVVKFVLYREWSYAVFMTAFIALGVCLRHRGLRREKARMTQTPPDPSTPTHPE